MTGRREGGRGGGASGRREQRRNGFTGETVGWNLRRWFPAKCINFALSWQPRRGSLPLLDRPRRRREANDCQPTTISVKFSRGPETTRLDWSLEAPHEHCQFLKQGAELAGCRRLLLQQDRLNCRQLLVAGEALVIPGEDEKANRSRFAKTFDIKHDEMISRLKSTTI